MSKICRHLLNFILNIIHVKGDEVLVFPGTSVFFLLLERQKVQTWQKVDRLFKLLTCVFSERKKKNKTLEESPNNLMKEDNKEKNP